MSISNAITAASLEGSIHDPNDSATVKFFKHMACGDDGVVSREEAEHFIDRFDMVQNGDQVLGLGEQAFAVHAFSTEGIGVGDLSVMGEGETLKYNQGLAKAANAEIYQESLNLESDEEVEFRREMRTATLLYHQQHGVGYE